MPFEFDGKKYGKASAHQKEWGARLIAELDLKGDECIIDLGSGDGVLTARLAELVPDGRVVGIDASRGMIEAARERQRDNLEFRLMDINDLSLELKFDLVFSNATLHWVTDHERLFANVLNVLKDNGVVRFNFAGDGNCANLFAVVKALMRQNKYARPFSGFAWPWYMPGIDEYRALARKCSLKETRVWPEIADRNFPNAEALIGWLDQPSLVPFLAHLDSKVGQEFRDTVVAEMLERTRKDDGTFFETFRRINLSARK